MFKYAVVLFALIACAAAKPHILSAAPLAYAAPVVTATSSQVIARNYNGIAAAPIIAAAPVAAPVVARYAAAAPLAAPLVSAHYAAAPLAAPVVSH
ncbi:cuticle protein 16.5-like [Zeugodacus cucurbitae]|uniref:cuticle protein 16.5-like n=1 Tax=Zeugodacus cucurbitae TaxID=28588 RepID=UPI0010A73DAB|nr:cuticle protein 16.5-like [Zeugodacus cucurbitae]